ncbi:MAG: ribosome maturation factor RimP [Candidatus Omnitrophota bacterium]|jgi:ribosome maturation factor RimP
MLIDKYTLQEKLREVISDYLKGEDVILVDLHLLGRRKKSILRILVDQPEGGITMDRCAHLNSAISQLLDRDNLIQFSYTLEVSSPGLDRPLVTYEDFSRCLNRKVRIFLSQCLTDKYEISGLVISVTEAGIELDSDGQIQNIPFQQIKKAKQIIEEIK